MGLLRPQFHGNADFIVEKLNEWLPGNARGCTSGYGPAHTRTGAVSVRNPVSASFCEQVRRWVQAESNRISLFPLFSTGVDPGPGCDQKTPEDKMTIQLESLSPVPAVGAGHGGRPPPTGNSVGTNCAVAFCCRRFRKPHKRHANRFWQANCKRMWRNFQEDAHD